MSNNDVMTENPIEFAYSPSAVLQLFNNSLNVAQSKKLFQFKGVYQVGANKSYNGYYYDKLKDEASDANITLIIPSLIRNRLINNKTISFIGYVTKRVVLNQSRIELQANLTDLIEQTHNKFSEEEIRALETQQRKALIGYRDVEAFMKDAIASGKTIRIVVIIGHSAIIDADIKHQQGLAVQPYNIAYQKANFSSEQDIIACMNKYDHEDVDIIVLARGGGESMEVFNKSVIAERSLSIKPFFISALGHKETVTLTEKVADKSFIAPTAFGQFLKDSDEHTVEEAEQSNAKLIESVKNQLETAYKKQIQNLREQLAAMEKLNETEKATLKTLAAEEKRSLETVQTQKTSALEWRHRSCLNHIHKMQL